MLGLSKIIATGLKADANIAAAFGTKIYPLFAPNKTKGSYIVFKVQMLEKISKDGIAEYNIWIWNYAKNYDLALQQAEIIAIAMYEVDYDNRVWKFTEGLKDPQITEGEDIYVEHVYSITTFADKKPELIVS